MTQEKIAENARLCGTIATYGDFKGGWEFPGGERNSISAVESYC